MILLPELHSIENTSENNIDSKIFNNAHTFSYLSDLAYQDPATIMALLSITEMDKFLGNFIYFDARISSTQGFVMKDNNNIIIVFRGTEYERIRGCIDDWSGNFCVELKEPLNRENQAVFGKANDNIVKVHDGFWSNLESIWDGIDGLFKNNNKKYTVWITGHSLGGAVATLTAARLAEQFKISNQADQRHTVGGVYTFGAPKCGNLAFVQYYEEQLGLKNHTFRFVNYDDPVPNIPYTGILAENVEKLVDAAIGKRIEGIPLVNNILPIANAVINRVVVDSAILPVVNRIIPKLNELSGRVIPSVYQAAQTSVKSVCESMLANTHRKNILEAATYHHVDESNFYYINQQGEISINTTPLPLESSKSIYKDTPFNELFELLLGHDHRKYLAKIKNCSSNGKDELFCYTGFPTTNEREVSTSVTHPFFLCYMPKQKNGATTYLPHLARLKRSLSLDSATSQLTLVQHKSTEDHHLEITALEEVISLENKHTVPSGFVPRF